MTDFELSKLFSAVVGFQNGLALDEGYDELHYILQMNNVTVTELKTAVSPTCTSMFERCMWKGTQTRCDTLFQNVDTSYGDCCAFNYYGTTKNNYPT